MSNLPPPLGAPPQPVMAYETMAPASPDDQHLRLLAILHYIWGGLTALFSSVALIHVGLGMAMVANRSAFASSGQAPPPAFVGWMFVLIGGAIVLLGWTLGGLTIYSGRCLAGRRNRTFSFIIAGLCCLSVPIGTALGVFTIIVLSRPAVKAQYDQWRQVGYRL